MLVTVVATDTLVVITATHETRGVKAASVYTVGMERVDPSWTRVQTSEVALELE